ncbi:hypothetical protein Fcan01_26449 [Folsomia candida]|uniref:Uncharacterized protein n=1 Tax=Folsomia candida TaxID=158441 RepID=A0A226D0W7_FOLCA|nr:hypothetical protein Fcan01_26449 [Folsomia candida]
MPRVFQAVLAVEILCGILLPKTEGVTHKHNKLIINSLTHSARKSRQVLYPHTIQEPVSYPASQNRTGELIPHPASNRLDKSRPAYIKRSWSTKRKILTFLAVFVFIAVTLQLYFCCKRRKGSA